MEKKEDTSFWLKFFKEAGLPSKTGASYAHIFIENRICKNMLSDLTVDYLRLMGITLMGDIIAILRHSKSVHQDSLRKVVILKSKEEPPSRRSSRSSSSDSSSSDDVRMVEVTKPLPKKPLSSISKISKHQNKEESPLHSDVKQVKSKVIGKTVSIKPMPSAIARTYDKKPSPEPIKRKRDVAMDVDPMPVKSSSTSAINTGKSILKSPTASAKKIRVTADNDIMGPKLPPPKKTVFDRLGSETSSPQVSSTTVDLAKPEVVETKFTRVISNVNIPLSSNIDNSSKMSTVFARLGGLTENPPETKPARPVLKYAGVLKSPSAEKRTPGNIMKRVGTMRADEPDIPVKLRATAKPLNKSLKVRVGESVLRKRLMLQERSTKPTQARGRLASTASEGIFANPYKQKITNNVKQRLDLSGNSGRIKSRNINMRRPFSNGMQRRTTNFVNFHDEDEEESYTFSSRVEMKDLKKVSFGNVERKLYTPVSSMYSARESKTKLSIHSRLGAVNYH